MRWAAILILVACSWWSWETRERRQPEPVLEAGAVSAAPAGLVDREAPESPLERWWRRLRGDSEPPRDPLVHCQLAAEGAFLRLSDCKRRGGFVDEPPWARLYD